MAAKRAACRTSCNPWDMRFPLCVGRMWDGTMFSSVCALPSGLRRRLLPFVVRLVHWYYGTVRLLLYVHVRRAVYGLRGPALIVRPRRAGDLPVLVYVVSQRARFSDYAGPNNHSRLAWLSCCLPPYRNGVGILILRLFEAQ